ncbi:MAG TPA: hypothetical protein DCE41_36080 [Cytophagales bacterium]|nr:hypothetical protein [Cytophagales bacterium]HAA18763.1 hypothetical protein [Cytophagales bacterium]HAP62483.1 hypothetical protein [Cytophagales bacterium]
MVTVLNLQKEPLVTLDGGNVRNRNKQIIARYKGAILYNLQGQVICTVVDGQPRNIQGEVIAAVLSNGEICNAKDEAVGHLEGGSADERALAAGAWMFLFAS